MVSETQLTQTNKTRDKTNKKDTSEQYQLKQTRK